MVRTTEIPLDKVFVALVSTQRPSLERRRVVQTLELPLNGVTVFTPLYEHNGPNELRFDEQENYITLLMTRHESIL